MKITIRKSLFYPCAVLWIVLLSKTYFFGVANRSTFQYAFYLTAILGVFVCRLSKIKIVMILHWLVPMLVFLLLNLILSLDTLQTDGLNAWFGKVIVIICSALLSSALPKKEFARWYIQIISFFAVISLVCVTM